MSRPYGDDFNKLCDDIRAMRFRRDSRILIQAPRKPKDRAQLAKALQSAVEAYSKPKHRPTKISETRQAAAAELREKMDDLIQRGAQAYANREISAQQLTELEVRWNAAMAQLQREGRL